MNAKSWMMGWYEWLTEYTCRGRYYTKEQIETALDELCNLAMWRAVTND